MIDGWYTQKFIEGELNFERVHKNIVKFPEYWKISDSNPDDLQQTTQQYTLSNTSEEYK